MFEVYLTDHATQDLEDIYHHIQRNDLPQKADYVLNQIEKAFSSLNENPARDSFPDELNDLGIREFREIYFKPYRIIYQIIDKNVYILLIADGRRDMQSLLQRRILTS